MTDFQIAEYDAVASQIEELKDIANFIPDASTDEGYAKSKRVSLDVGKVKTTLEKVRKDKKAYYIKGGKEVDIQAKSIKEKLDEIQSPHQEAYKLVDDIKKKREAERKERLDRRVSDLRLLPDNLADSPSDEIQLALSDLNNEECLDFYEFTEQALKARNSSRTSIANLLVKRKKEEDDAAELAKLRKQAEERKEADKKEEAKKAEDERMREVADKAAKDLKAEKEKTESARIETNTYKINAVYRLGINLSGIDLEYAESLLDQVGYFDPELLDEDFLEKARLVKSAAIKSIETYIVDKKNFDEERAKEKKIAAKREAEKLANNAKLAAEQKVKDDKKADAEAAREREADKKHKASIHSDILDDLLGIKGLNLNLAKAVLKKIATGKHTSIKY